MQAVQLTDHGGPEVLSYGEVPDPEPAGDEVLLDVKAGSLNHLDVWTRRGLPGLDLAMPHVPGSDAAGVVEAAGDDVSRFSPGDRAAVWAGVNCGDCEFCRRGEPTLCVRYHVLGEHVPGVAERALERVWDGTFEVRIRERLPMSETARGHELLEAREGFGKVVVVPDSEYHD